MLLKELVSGLELEKTAGSLNVPVEGLAYDSRKVKQNYLFACLRGSKYDGHGFAGEAVRKGASCILCESETDESRVPGIVVKNSRRALSAVSAKFYGFPSRSMNVVGITGTNGKTSVAYLCEAVGKEAGFNPGVMGTINYRWGGRILPAPQTTPESLETQDILSQMKSRGCDYVFMEASSHGISQHRLDDVTFKSAVFTNLSPEHMDYHSDIEDYFAAKAALFDKLLSPSGSAVINTDDSYGRRLAEGFASRKLTCGVEGPADVTASEVSLGSDGAGFTLASDFGSGRVSIKLLGMGNVYNALSAACVGFLCGVEFQTVVNALEKVESIKGRFEIIDRGGDFTVAVDYAHTPSALGLLLDSARKFSGGRIITVFGCGGDRDRSKRPAMGAIAALKSDFSVLTTDNPRGEDPRSIISEIEEGFIAEGKINYEVVTDRKEAIGLAISAARKGDIVLIAGKGHETYQILKNTVIPFDDSEIAKEALEIIRGKEIGA